jgi:EAL domain-containing protein (putative c-di-GMP-specific phosphodiesterase class I)
MAKKKNVTWTSPPGTQLSPVAVEESERTVRSLTTADLTVHYQPIVDLQNGQLFAHEALARCNVEKFANPLRLFQEAVKEKTCGYLGRTIREIVVEQNPGTRLFVNIHPVELASRWLVRPDDPICSYPEQIYLEITESATLEYYDLCVSVLKEVCARTGAYLVIDDLGAGYSNLKRLIDLYPAVVKLDLTLARDLDKDTRKQILVRHLVELCVDLGAKVVVEGIETLDELMAARDTGAHYAQGYLLARPSFPPPVPTWPL